MEVHDVLRPAARRARARLREGLPDRLHPVRPAGRAAGDRRRPGSPSCTPAASPRHGCTAPIRPTGSAGRVRSSCCSTSQRSTACRLTRWSRPGICRRCGGGPAPPPPCWRPASRSRSPGGAHDRATATRPSSCRCRRRTSSPTTAGRYSRSPGGKSRTCRPTCSSASCQARWRWSVRSRTRPAPVTGPDRPAGRGGERVRGRRGLTIELGRPERFLHMLRVAKPTSPMSIGSWILPAHSGLVSAAAATEVTGRLRVARRRRPAPRPP